eukprot:6932180-Pyramimonas_sp.AAC.1
MHAAQIFGPVIHRLVVWDACPGAKDVTASGQLIDRVSPETLVKELPVALGQVLVPSGVAVGAIEKPPLVPTSA